VIEGQARIGSTNTTVGDAIFAEADRADIELDRRDERSGCVSRTAARYRSAARLRAENNQSGTTRGRLAEIERDCRGADVTEIRRVAFIGNSLPATVE